MNDEKKLTAAPADAGKIPFQEIFTEHEAAAWLKVSRITLQRARLRGEIAFARVGGCRVIYTRRQIEDYLNSRERAAYTPARPRKTQTEAA